MPKLRVCARPGCPTLTPAHYCQAHEANRRRASDAKRQHTRSNYGDPRWRRCRASYLATHPMCEAGCGSVAMVVHHLDGLGLRGPRAFDPTNLEALCKPCHDRTTAREQPGGWHAH